MSKFRLFFIKIKPYKKLYKGTILIIFIICTFFFFNFMFLLSYLVPHNHSAYFYWYKGFHKIFSSIFENYETRACLGFLASGTIIGYIPMLAVVPFCFFYLVNYCITNVISKKFINLPIKKYKFYSSLIRDYTIGTIFIIICSIILLLSGYNPFNIFSLASAMGGVFSDSDSLRYAGISSFLQIGVGFLFFGIPTIKLLWLALVYIVKIIWKYFIMIMSSFFVAIGSIFKSTKNKKNPKENDLEN